MSAHRVGYARISTPDQNLDLQLDALNKAGSDKIRKGTISGTNAQRPGLTQALDTLRDGNALVVWKLNRLGRSVKDLLDFAGDLNNRGVGFISLTDAIDTTTVSGHFFFSVIASLAQVERELMVESPQTGLQAAREQGRVGGRKRIMTETKIRSARKLLNQGAPPREVAETLGVSVPALYRWVPATGATRAPAQ